MLVKTPRKRRKGEAKKKAKIKKIGIIPVNRFTEIATVLKRSGVELTTEAETILENTLGRAGKQTPNN
jgi:hypothetical protein